MLIRLPRATIWRWLLLSLITSYFVLCLCLFFVFVKPSFLGGNHLRIGADSNTYLAVAGVITDNSINAAELKLVSFSGNFLGPVMIAKLVPSLFGIAMLDLLMFAACLWLANGLPGVRLGIFFWAIVLNPLTTPSLLTLNKEIISFLSVMLLMRYISNERHSWLLLLAVLFTAIMARWEQAVVTACFLVVESRWSPLRGRPLLTIMFVIAGITLAYPFLVNTAIVNIAELIGAGAEGNIMPRLNALQAHYGFPLIVAPKILLNLWGEVLRPSYFWTDYLKGDFSDIQNFIAIPFDCVATFVVSVIAVLRGRVTLRKQSIYWMTIYLVATAATPLFQPRYQFAVYVILCLEISGFSVPLRATSARKVRNRRMMHFLRLACER